MLAELKNIKVKLIEKNKYIVNGINLTIRGGETHAIMGPNGSGKSTLVNALAGHPSYEIEGSFKLNGKELLELKPEERAKEGLFLSFQIPPFLEGVKLKQMLRKAYFKINNLDERDVENYETFEKELKNALNILKLPEEFLEREVNKAFSGGEKKKSEMLQMLLLKPKLALIDEVDSGLDVDALKIVSNAINKLKDGDRGFLIITHYSRILHYVEPTHVHVMVKGKIIESGKKELAWRIEEEGYHKYLNT